ncbi:MAG TPA: FxDxF family PEP-CTERM protein [Phenylobacterium sp.]|jgi:hypothetical protein
MKSALAGIAAALLFATAAPAFAATTITIPPAAPDGTISGIFGDTNIAFGDFTDVFTFTLPSGTAAATISSISTNTKNNVDFTTVSFNGHDFAIDSTGKVEFRHLDDILVSEGTQTLTVSGHSGGKGSYAGTIAFSAVPPITGGGGGVPEPAAWALMILGFGGVGATLRSRKTVARLAA